VFMVPFSLGLAITVRVGHNLGMHGARTALFSAKVGIAVALFCATVSATALLLLAEQLPHIYTRDPAVLALSSSLLFYAALYQFSDSVQVACAGALRGYQDTRIPMLLTMIAYWLVGLPSGYVLGLTDLLGAPRGPAGFWLGLILGLTAAALFLSLRLAVIGGRRKRVLGAPMGLPGTQPPLPGPLLQSKQDCVADIASIAWRLHRRTSGCPVRAEGDAPTQSIRPIEQPPSRARVGGIVTAKKLSYSPDHPALRIR